MAIKSNSYYNDPAMAQAAANLADLFAPPSGSDAAGYSLAQARDQETSQRKAMWDYSQRPDFDQGLLDRAGVIADLYDPSNSYYSVDKTADTARYGYDTQAATSRSNNEADNIRALAANAADNQRALRLGEEQALMHPLAQGERINVPPSIASMYEVDPVLQGNAKPLSETEVKGDLLSRMVAGDTQGIADELLVKQALLGTEGTPTIDPMTGQPVITPRFDATGKQPVLSETEEKGRVFATLPEEQRKQSVVDIKGQDTYTAVNPDGSERSFVGYIGSDNRVYDQAHPEQPAEGVVRKGSGQNQFAVDFDETGRVIGIRQGAGVGKAPTDAQNKAAFAAEMLEKPTKIILDAFDTNKLPTTADVSVFQILNKAATSDSFALSAAIPYFNSALSSEGQTFFAAMQQALPYELMVRSGQAVTEGEYARKLIAMVPLASDNPETKAIKRNAFDTAQKAILRLAGAAAPPAAGAATAAPAAAPAAVSPQATATPENPPPAATAPAAAAPEAMSPEDRAASIANAKAAIAKAPDKRQQIIERLQTAIPGLKPEELQ